MIQKKPLERFLDSYINSKSYFEDSTDRLLAGDRALPLLTWPFLDFIVSQNLASNRLIELGSGASTIWFADLFSNVVSFETDSKWKDLISDRVAPNTEVIFSTVEKLEVLDLGNVSLCPIDWLLIDFSGHRLKTVKALGDHCSRSGCFPSAIVFDNSENYRNASRKLVDLGYFEIPFFGLKSGAGYVGCTSLFLRDLQALRGSYPFRTPPGSSLITSNLWDQP